MPGTDLPSSHPASGPSERPKDRDPSSSAVQGGKGRIEEATHAGTNLKEAKKEADELKNGTRKDGKESKPSPEPTAEQLKAEHEQLKSLLEIRVSGFRKNVERGQKELKSMGWIRRGIAAMSGVSKGIKETIRQDQAVVDSADALLKDLQKAEKLGPNSLRKELDLVRGKLGMAKPDYRDANADLARGSDKLAPYDVISRTPERLPFTAGTELYVQIDEQTVEKGWIIKSAEKNRIEVTKDGKTLTLTAAQVWHVSEIEGGKAMNRKLSGNIAADKLNRRNTLMERYARLSEAEYIRLFDGPMQQQNVGNCYLIAAFESLYHSGEGEIILRTSVRVSGDGYDVKLPLADADGKWIHISRKEMGVMASLDIAGERQDLRPVDAKEGWVALEAAYAKYKFGTVNRKMMSGGFGSKALQTLFGSAIQPDIVTSDTYKEPFSADKAATARAEKWLNGFSNERDIATVNTPRRKEGDKSTFMVGKIPFYYSHAYSLINVDAAQKKVIVANPHDTSEAYRLTYDTFMKTFADISSARIDDRKIFKTA